MQSRASLPELLGAGQAKSLHVQGAGQHGLIPACQLDHSSIQQRIDRLEGLVATAAAKQEVARNSAEDTILKGNSGDWNNGISQPSLALAREENCLAEKPNGPGMLTITDGHSHYKGETPWDDVLEEVGPQ